MTYSSPVLTGSPSRGGDVAVYVLRINQPSLPTPFFLLVFLCSVLVSVFGFYGPFSCISFHKFSRQLSTFSLCSSGLISHALLVLSTMYLLIKVSLSPDIILLWLIGLKATNYLTNYSSPIP